MLKNISIPQRPDGTIYFLFLFFLKTVKILFFLIFIFTLFCFTILYWFCHILTWIHHRCTWVPKHEPHLPPHIISLDHPRAPAPSILYPASNIDWQFVSFMIVYMFQGHSPKSSHPLPLPQSLKVRSTWNYSLIYNVVLVSGVLQGESVTHTHIATFLRFFSHIGHYRV